MVVPSAQITASTPQAGTCWQKEFQLVAYRICKLGARRQRLPGGRYHPRNGRMRQRLRQRVSANKARRTKKKDPHCQNIVLAFLEVAGTGCSTSQCSTILPSASKRKISTPAVS
jgi:hypothetical protein